METPDSNKAKEPLMGRRTALKVIGGVLGGLALAGGVRWYSGEDLEPEADRVKPEELADLESAINERISKIDEEEKLFQTQLAEAKADVEPLFAKYGTPENPKLFVKQTTSQNQDRILNRLQKKRMQDSKR